MTDAQIIREVAGMVIERMRELGWDFELRIGPHASVYFGRGGIGLADHRWNRARPESVSDPHRPSLDL